MSESEQHSYLSGCALAALPFVPMSVIPYAPSIMAGAMEVTNGGGGKQERHGSVFPGFEKNMLFGLDTLRLVVMAGVIADKIHTTQLVPEGSHWQLFAGVVGVGLIESIRVMSRGITYEEVLD